MRIGAFEILLFFICLNLGCFILNEMEALPYTSEAIETPESINQQFYYSIGGSIAIIAGGVLTGLLLNAIAQGAVIALIIAALSWLVPILKWVFFGFSDMLLLMGTPAIICTVIQVLIGVVWVWFLIGIVAQRYME